MTVTQYGVPGGSLTTTAHSYGSAARAGAFFERRVAAALTSWLNSRPELTYLFHDLGRLRTTSRSGRKLDLGNANIDHVLLTGVCSAMFDAKGIAPGKLVIDGGRGYLITSTGQRRPQPWLDDRRALARAGALHDLTGLIGIMIWVLPELVDFSELCAESTPRCLSYGGVFISIDDVASGRLEGTLPCRQPYVAPDRPP
jgi:hypothetical protein